MSTKEASKICHNCGKNISVTAKVCSHCNADAFARDPDRAYSQISDMNSENVYIPAGKRNSVIKGVLELLVVVGIIYIIYANGYISLPK
ncbi:MAG: hypothetical protein GY804_07570 [Alphaproteobacteria bacterium]|nr:hypothetical protein [Alphaproteobacteria bacterium]